MIALLQQWITNNLPTNNF